MNDVFDYVTANVGLDYAFQIKDTQLRSKRIPWMKVTDPLSSLQTVDYESRFIL